MSLCPGSPELEGGLNFDQVHVNQAERRELSISNKSDKPIIVKDVNASCSCVRVMKLDQTISPHKDGSISIEYRPVKPGKASIEILVETDGRDQALHRFHWEGTVLPAADPREHPGIETNDLFLSSGQLASTLSHDGWHVVDVRNAQQYNDCHIGESMNIPWPAPKQGGLAHAKQIVITGSGSDDDRVISYAVELQKIGSAVRVLRGGVRNWAMQGRPVSGSNTSGAGPATIAAPEFGASVRSEWLVVDVVDPAVSRRSKLSEGSVLVAVAPEDREKFARELRDRVQARPGVLKVLLVSEVGEHYEQMESSLPKGLGCPVFYLEGGRRAWNQFTALETAMLDRRTVTRVSGGGGNAVSGGSVIQAPGGCGSCPKANMRK